MSNSRVTTVHAEVDITAGSNAKRGATAAYAEVDLTAGANAKRGATAIWVEVDIGYVIAQAQAITRSPMWGRF